MTNIEIRGGISPKGRYLRNYVSIAFVVIGLVFLIVGICLMATKKGECSTNIPPKNKTSGSTDKSTGKETKIRNLDEYCAWSEEAKDKKLENVLQKVVDLYYILWPGNKAGDTAKTQDEKNRLIREFSRPYVPHPKYLKDLTDKMDALSNEIKQMSFDKSKMKPKENQILVEAQAFLQQYFAQVYDIEFYGGDWMFGPNYFCQSRMCQFAYDIETLSQSFRPESADDLRFVMKSLNYTETFDVQISNMKLGVETGMVRSKIVCWSGKEAYKSHYKKYLLEPAELCKHFENTKFLSRLSAEEQEKWKQMEGKPINESICEAIKNGFIKPLVAFNEYLTKNHSVHCPPDDVASGLSALPLDFVYVNGVPDKNRTTSKILPMTNIKLNGSKLYARIMPSFTTVNDLSPVDVYNEGLRQLDIFYPQIVNISMKLTNRSQQDEAVEEIKKVLDADDQWHGELTFPEIESNETAYSRCTGEKSAKQFCPVRWKSIMKWAKYLEHVLAMQHPKLTNFFHFTGSKNTVPNCPVKMIPHFIPSNGAFYFDRSDAQCSKPCVYAMPFFLNKYGPKFSEWSVSGHEARPGHHFQYQGQVELFPDPCGGIRTLIHSQAYFVGFIEGWALYGENPLLSDDVDLYADNELQRLGMIKWQIWRAVRLFVDTGLHYRGMNRTWALEQFRKYTWDDTDFAAKEITRYMSCPGQATGYMIGRLAIIKARKKAEVALGADFNLKDFHQQLLSLGQSSLGYMAEYLDRWVECVKDPNATFCEYVLTPVSGIPKGNYSADTQANTGMSGTFMNRRAFV